MGFIIIKFVIILVLFFAAIDILCQREPGQCEYLSPGTRSLSFPVSELASQPESARVYSRRVKRGARELKGVGFLG